jgi:hypothetical protein
MSGWDCLNQRWGCPHCTAAFDGRHPPHFLGVWSGSNALGGPLGGLGTTPYLDAPGVELKQAVFLFHLPRSPGHLWRRLSDAHSIADAETTTDLHTVVHTARQQHVHTVLVTIWKWRPDIDAGRLRWDAHAAKAYLTVALLYVLLQSPPQDQPLRTTQRPTTSRPHHDRSSLRRLRAADADQTSSFDANVSSFL